MKATKSTSADDHEAVAKAMESVDKDSAAAFRLSAAAFKAGTADAHWAAFAKHDDNALLSQSSVRSDGLKGKTDIYKAANRMAKVHYDTAKALEDSGK